MISRPAPGTFTHVAHVGFDAEGRLEASDSIKAEWSGILDEEDNRTSAQGVRQETDNSPDFFADIKLAGHSPMRESAIIIPDPGESSCLDRSKLTQTTAQFALVICVPRAHGGSQPSRFDTVVCPGVKQCPLSIAGRTITAFSICSSTLRRLLLNHAERTMMYD